MNARPPSCEMLNMLDDLIHHEADARGRIDHFLREHVCS